MNLNQLNPEESGIDIDLMKDDINYFREEHGDGNFPIFDYIKAYNIDPFKFVGIPLNDDELKMEIWDFFLFGEHKYLSENLSEIVDELYGTLYYGNFYNKNKKKYKPRTIKLLCDKIYDLIRDLGNQFSSPYLNEELSNKIRQYYASRISVRHLQNRQLRGHTWGGMTRQSTKRRKNGGKKKISKIRKKSKKKNKKRV